MKSRWTILLDLAAWQKYVTEFKDVVSKSAPEQYPCLATITPNSEGKFDLIYVYKQEAYVLNACPTDYASYNPKHPFPETP